MGDTELNNGQEHTQYLKEVYNRSQESFDKYLIVISAGFFVTVSGLLPTIDDGSRDDKWLLVLLIALIWAFGFSVLITTLSMFASAQAAKFDHKQAVEKKAVQAVEKRAEQAAGKKAERRISWKSTVPYMNKSSMILFSLGVVTMMVYLSKFFFSSQ